MAGIVDVADPGDPRLADYMRLTDVRLRTSMEPAHGLFMAEGEKVIRRAVAAGFGVRSMLVTRDRLAGLAGLRAAGFTLLALTPDQSAVPLGEVRPAARVALLLGTEGDGLSARWLAEADTPVCVPMSATAMALGVDSLNVVAAAAIACHELARLPR